MNKRIDIAIKSKYIANDPAEINYGKSISPILPESSRINSQFHVMRGTINRSKTLKINKFSNPKSNEKVMSEVKKKYVNSLRDDFGLNKDRAAKSSRKMYHDKKYSKIYNMSPKNSKYLVSMKSRISNLEDRGARILVRDDACLNEKELNLSNSINYPIPGLVIKSQFNKEISQRAGPIIYDGRNKNNYLPQKNMTTSKSYPNQDLKLIQNSPFKSVVYNEPKRQEIMHIRPHLKCNH
jgi:hypothetical protein